MGATLSAVGWDPHTSSPVRGRCHRILLLPEDGWRRRASRPAETQCHSLPSRLPPGSVNTLHVVQPSPDDIDVCWNTQFQAPAEHVQART